MANGAETFGLLRRDECEVGLARRKSTSVRRNLLLSTMSWGVFGLKLMKSLASTTSHNPALTARWLFCGVPLACLVVACTYGVFHRYVVGSIIRLLFVLVSAFFLAFCVFVLGALLWRLVAKHDWVLFKRLLPAVVDQGWFWSSVGYGCVCGFHSLALAVSFWL